MIEPDNFEDVAVLTHVANHAEEFPDQEVCGIVIDGEVIRGKNVHPNPVKYFDLDPDSLALENQAIEAGKHCITYHSHIGEKEYRFSPHDAIGIMESQVPGLLYHVPSKFFSFKDPTLNRPYEGRRFNWVFDNCFTLSTEWLRREKGVIIAHFQLFDPDEWQHPEWDRLNENLPKQGFREVYSPQVGDWLTMVVGRTYNANHLGVVVQVQPVIKFLHHCFNCLSIIEEFDLRYKNLTTNIWRHEQLF